MDLQKNLTYYFKFFFCGVRILTNPHPSPSQAKLFNDVIKGLGVEKYFLS